MKSPLYIQMHSFASSNEYNNNSQLFQSLADNASVNHKIYVGNPIFIALINGGS